MLGTHLRSFWGSLKAAKCYWYLVDFAWKDGEWFYKQTENHSCTIAGDDKQGYRILSLPANEPRKIMGVWQNLTGDNSRQIEEMIAAHSEMIQRV